MTNANLQALARDIERDRDRFDGVIASIRRRPRLRQLFGG